MNDPVHGLIAAPSDLSRTERAVFARLAACADALVTRSDLLGVIRGNAPHTLDSHVMAIRRKLLQSGSPATIETVKGSGFILRLHP